MGNLPNFLSSAFWISAKAAGWDDNCSTLAALRKISSVLMSSLLLLSKSMIFSTTGVPNVIVPVLSNTTTLAFPICSIDAPLLMIIPIFAALLIPLMIAIGVANISEHGVATTNTERIVCGLYDVRTHPITLTTSTMGVNHAAYLSASLWIGAFSC